MVHASDTQRAQIPPTVGTVVYSELAVTLQEKSLGTLLVASSNAIDNTYIYAVLSIHSENLHGIQNLDFNHSTLVYILLPLSSMWRQLGVALTLAPYLDEINSSNQEKNRLQALLYTWEHIHIKPYTWETLINALYKVGATDLAAALERKLGYN